MSNELKEDELKKFKNLLQKEKVIKEKGRAIKEEIQRSLNEIVFIKTTVLYRIPKTKRILLKKIKELISSNVRQRPWLDLRILSYSKNGVNEVYIFAKEKDIISNITEITKRIIAGRRCKIGDIGISFSFEKNFNLKNFIKPSS